MSVSSDGYWWVHVQEEVAPRNLSLRYDDILFRMTQSLASRNYNAVLYAMTVLHTISLNVSPDMRGKLVNPALNAKFEDIANGRSNTLAAALTQLLHDWEALFGDEQLGKAYAGILRHLRNTKRAAPGCRVSDAALAYKRKPTSNDILFRQETMQGFNFGRFNQGARFAPAPVSRNVSVGSSLVAQPSVDSPAFARGGGNANPPQRADGGIYSTSSGEDFVGPPAGGGRRDAYNANRTSNETLPAAGHRSAPSARQAGARGAESARAREGMVSDEPGPGEVQDISGRRTQEPSKASGLIASRAKAMLPSQPPEGTVGPLNETLNPGELDLMEANRGPKEPPIAGRGPTQHVREPLNDNRMAGDFVGANSPKVRPSNTRASTTAQGMPTAVGVPAAKVAAAADDIWGAFNPKSRAMMPIPEQESTVSGASISRRSSDRGSVTSGRYQEQTSSGDVSPTVAEKRRRNEKQAAQLNKAAGRSPMHVADAATYSAAPGPPRPTNEPVTSIHRDPIRNVQSDTEPRKGAEASGTPDSTTDRIPLPTSLKAVGALSGAAQASPFSAQPLDGTASFGSSAHGNREASPARASSVDDLLQRASNRCDRLVYLCSQVEGSRAKAIPDEKVEHLAQRAAQEVRQLQVSLKQARLAEKTPELRAQLAMHQQDCEETLQKWERLFEGGDTDTGKHGIVENMEPGKRGHLHGSDAVAPFPSRSPPPNATPAAMGSQAPSSYMPPSSSHTTFGTSITPGVPAATGSVGRSTFAMTTNTSFEATEATDSIPLPRFLDDSATVVRGPAGPPFNVSVPEHAGASHDSVTMPSACMLGPAGDSFALTEASGTNPLPTASQEHLRNSAAENAVDAHAGAAMAGLSSQGSLDGAADGSEDGGDYGSGAESGRAGASAAERGVRAALGARKAVAVLPMHSSDGGSSSSAGPADERYDERAASVGNSAGGPVPPRDVTAGSERRWGAGTENKLTEMEVIDINKPTASTPAVGVGTRWQRKERGAMAPSVQRGPSTQGVQDGAGSGGAGSRGLGKEAAAFGPSVQRGPPLEGNAGKRDGTGGSGVGIRGPEEDVVAMAPSVQQALPAQADAGKRGAAGDGWTEDIEVTEVLPTYQAPTMGLSTEGSGMGTRWQKKEAATGAPSVQQVPLSQADAGKRDGAGDGWTEDIEVTEVLPTYQAPTMGLSTEGVGVGTTCKKKEGAAEGWTEDIDVTEVLPQYREPRMGLSPEGSDAGEAFALRGKDSASNKPRAKLSASGSSPESSGAAATAAHSAHAPKVVVRPSGGARQVADGAAAPYDLRAKRLTSGSSSEGSGAAAVAAGAARVAKDVGRPSGSVRQVADGDAAVAAGAARVAKDVGRPSGSARQVADGAVAAAAGAARVAKDVVPPSDASKDVVRPGGAWQVGDGAASPSQRMPSLPLVPDMRTVDDASGDVDVTEVLPQYAPPVLSDSTASQLSGNLGEDISGLSAEKSSARFVVDAYSSRAAEDAGGPDVTSPAQIRGEDCKHAVAATVEPFASDGQRTASELAAHATARATVHPSDASALATEAGKGLPCAEEKDASNTLSAAGRPAEVQQQVFWKASLPGEDAPVYRTLSAPSSLVVNESAMELVAFDMALRQPALRMSDPRYISLLVRNAVHSQAKRYGGAAL